MSPGETMSIRTAVRATRPRRRSRARAALAVPGSALAASLLLAGCSFGPDGPPPPPFDAVAMPADPPVATPGQRVAAGEVVALPGAGQAGTSGDAVAASVLGIAEGRASYWSGYDDGARFADRIPFFAFVQTRSLQGERASADGPVLRPFLADGTEADIIQSQLGGVSAAADCPYEVPDLALEDGRDPDERMECVVYAVPVGQELAELRWHDVPRTVVEAPDPATHPFLAAPVVWAVDALPAEPVEG
jgi:hypothetical protein